MTGNSRNPAAPAPTPWWRPTAATAAGVLRRTLMALAIVLAAPAVRAEGDASAGTAAGSIPVGARFLFAFEASPLRGTIGVAHRLTPGLWLGWMAGGGPDVSNKQIVDRKARFMEILHAGIALRSTREDVAWLEIGLRMGVADRCRDTGSCEFSPGVFGGVSAAVLAGWRHFRLGPRVTVARYAEQGWAPRTEAWVSPLNLWYCAAW